MGKRSVGVISFLLISCVVFGSTLPEMCQKLPDGTFGFVATSGTDNFQGDFNSSIFGQVAADPQVKAFFEQIIASVSNAPSLEEAFGQGEDAIAFGKGLLASPTILAIVGTSEKLTDEPSAILISSPITRDSDQGKLLMKMLAGEIAAGRIVEKQVAGCTTFASNDPNSSESYYISLTNDCLLAAFNDDQFAVLQGVSANQTNYELVDKLAEVPTSNDAAVLYFDFQKLLAVIKQEAADDPDGQQVLEVFRSLGIADMQYYLFKAGFSGKNMTLDGKIKMSTTTGLWNAFGPIDKNMFSLADPKSIQTNALYLSPVDLYDTIMGVATQIAQSEGTPLEPQIAQFEEQLGFKLRDDLLASIEGSMMGYMLPPYASPELLTGGYTLIARLKDADKFKKCMLSVETLVESMAPADQLQISVQKDASGKEIHIWAVSLMALLQVMPSWTIEGDMLVFASHPTLTQKMTERIAAGTGESLVSNAEYSNAMSQIPNDAFSASLTDSKSQARQMMTALQQYWPVLNMGLAEEGIKLPIMLPSIEPYIEQMQPGFSYTRKMYDGIEFHYEGSGLEATTGAVAGGAVGAAILMPALNKTKKIAQRVVCGTNLKGLSIAMVVYCNDYDDVLPTENWCDLLIEEADVSPKSFVCPDSDAIEGESSYALNKNIAGKNLGQLPADVVLYFETDKGIGVGPRNTSITTRRHYAFVNEFSNVYDEGTMVYKDRFNQLGGPEDLALHHNDNSQLGCNIAYADGHTEFVTADRIADLRWNPD